MQILRRFATPLLALCAFTPPALAQTSRPESGFGERFDRPTPELTPLPTERSPVRPPVPESDRSGREIQVREVTVVGSSILSEAEWREIVAPLLAKVTVTERDIGTVADAITRIYVRQGFLSSRAIAIGDRYGEGIVEIRVIEGTIAAIEIEGLQGVNESYVRRRLERATRAPLNATKLEDALRLLQNGPLFDAVAARLRKGEGPGESILRVEFAAADPFDLAISLDNYSPIAVGGERLGTTIAYNNLTGNGDRLAATVGLTSQDGSQTYEGSYAIPLNALDGTLAFRALFNNNAVVAPDDIAALDIEGEFELYDIRFRQPVIRSSREELAFSIGFAYTAGRTFLLNEPTSFGFGPDADGESAVAQIRLGQDYLKRSLSGSWLVRNQFNIGTKLFDATENTGSIPDGQFFSWLLQARRVRLLGARHSLIFALDSQLASEPLLPVEQFSVGGGQSVRGYRQNLIAGDNGVRVSIEDRIAVARDRTGRRIFQVAPYFDAAVVWNNQDNPNILAFDRNTLVGLGVGLIWTPNRNFNIRLDYGQDLVDFGTDSSNIQNDGLYFSVGWNLNP